MKKQVKFILCSIIVPIILSIMLVASSVAFYERLFINSSTSTRLIFIESDNGNNKYVVQVYYNDKWSNTDIYTYASTHKSYREMYIYIMDEYKESLERKSIKQKLPFYGEKACIKTSEGYIEEK